VLTGSPGRRRGARRVVIAAVAALAAVAVVSRGNDLHVGRALHGGIQGPWLAAALTANLLSIVAKAGVWKTTVLPVDRRAASLRLIGPALFIGFLANTVLVARAGEVIRVVVLQRLVRRAGRSVPFGALAGTVVTENLLLGVSVAVVTAGLLVVEPLPAWVTRATIGLAVVLGSVVLLLLVASGRLRPRRAARPESRWMGHLRALVGTGTELLRHPLLMLGGVGIGCLSWVAQLVSIDWTMRAFGLDLGVPAAALVFVTTTLAGIVPILPGNVVAFQGAVALALVSTYGVATAHAIAFSIGLQLVEMVFGLGLGSLFLVLTSLSLADLRSAGGDDPPTSGAG
jgi:uncharacterized membrane protein YbhN (UPF0104 family)